MDVRSTTTNDNRAMMIGNIVTVTILTILLFGIPIIISGIYTRLLKTFSFTNFTSTLNWAFIGQMAIGISCLYSFSYAEDYYTSGIESHLIEIAFDTAYTYIIIGTFIYFPALVILNFVNVFLYAKLRSRS